LVFTFTENSYPSQQGAFLSSNLRFLVYNRSGDRIEAFYPFEIDWPYFEEYFINGNNYKPSNYKFDGVNHIAISENIKRSSDAISELFANGVEPSNLKIFRREVGEVSITETVLRMGEDIDVNDFTQLVNQLQSLGVSISAMNILSVEDKDFQFGSVSILDRQMPKSQSVTQSEIDSVIKEKSLSTLFEKFGLRSTSLRIFQKRLMLKAIRLNDEQTRQAGEKALEITEYLMNHEFDDTRLYAEMARAYGRLHGVKNGSNAKQ